MKERIFKTEIDGVKLSFAFRDVRAERGMMKDLIRRRAYVKQHEKLFGKIDRDGRCIDVGGNIGVCSVIYEKVYGFRTIQAFEPVPWTADLFRKNIARNGCKSVEFLAVAVDEEDGEREIHYDHVSFASASFWSAKKRTAKVKTVAAGRMISESPVSLLKLDCEGAEFPILESASLTGVENLIVEFHPAFCKDYAKRLKKIMAEITKSFDIQKFDDLVNINVFGKRRTS